MSGDPGPCRFLQKVLDSGNPGWRVGTGGRSGRPVPPVDTRTEARRVPDLCGPPVPDPSTDHGTPVITGPLVQEGTTQRVGPFSTGVSRVPERAGHTSTGRHERLVRLMDTASTRGAERLHTGGPSGASQGCRVVPHSPRRGEDPSPLDLLPSWSGRTRDLSGPRAEGYVLRGRHGH